MHENETFSDPEFSSSVGVVMYVILGKPGLCDLGRPIAGRMFVPPWFPEVSVLEASRGELDLVLAGAVRRRDRLFCPS